MIHKPGIFVISFVFTITPLMLVACDQRQGRDEQRVTPAPTWTPTARAAQAVTAPAPTSAPTATPTVTINRLAPLSPIDGHLVYVSSNDLIACDALGGNRRVSVDGPHVPLVNLQYATARYGPTLTVSAPRFSPDGQRLAFGLGGVKLMAVGGAAVPVTILASDPYTPTSNVPTTGSYFLPYAWSPDGTKLLVQINGYWEGIGWAVVDPHSSSDSQVYAHLPACCDPVWSLNGEAVYLSDASGVVGPPGLRRFAMASGALASTIEQMSVAFPHESRAGVLWAFASSGTLAPTGFDKLTMHRIELNNAGSAQLVRLSADDYAVWEVLWAGDDSGALIVERNDISGLALFTGVLIWLPADGSPGVQLRALGSHPRWGLASSPRN